MKYVLRIMIKLDLGSIRSSPRFGLSTLYNSAGLFHHDLIYMGDLHLVLPALNLYTLDAGILIIVHCTTSKIDDVLTEHGGLLHVLNLA